MLTVLLLCLSGELMCQELDRVHRWNERVDVVLCKVAAASRERIVKLTRKQAFLAKNNLHA